MPEPEVCRVLDLDLHPGGSFRTELRLPDGGFGPHITGCFLAVDPQERLVFTDALGFHDGWGMVVAQLARFVESRRSAEGRA
ncbi:SRPBCC domain-containing protein [Zhihengliuella halotolerans]|uniref:SRPBCC domain-containing protein n=1 Tax=Zhihengliuella halotolerans TaxID=370736 RepID=UPI001F5EA59F|nr:SRPBCC domain-containing protein [Zhihengliuella halotolerans]